MMVMTMLVVLMVVIRVKLGMCDNVDDGGSDDGSGVDTSGEYDPDCGDG